MRRTSQIPSLVPEYVQPTPICSGIDLEELSIDSLGRTIRPPIKMFGLLCPRQPSPFAKLKDLKFEEPFLERWFEARGFLDWDQFAHEVKKHNSLVNPNIPYPEPRWYSPFPTRGAHYGLRHDSSKWTIIHKDAKFPGVPVKNPDGEIVQYERTWTLPVDAVIGSDPKVYIEDRLRALKCLIELVDTDPSIFAGLERADRAMLSEYWKATGTRPRERINSGVLLKLRRLDKKEDKELEKKEKAREAKAKQAEKKRKKTPSEVGGKEAMVATAISNGAVIEPTNTPKANEATMNLHQTMEEYVAAKQGRDPRQEDEIEVNVDLFAFTAGGGDPRMFGGHRRSNIISEQNKENSKPPSGQTVTSPRVILRPVSRLRLSDAFDRHLETIPELPGDGESSTTTTTTTTTSSSTQQPSSSTSPPAQQTSSSVTQQPSSLPPSSTHQSVSTSQVPATHSSTTDDLDEDERLLEKAFEDLAAHMHELDLVLNSASPNPEEGTEEADQSLATLRSAPATQAVVSQAPAGLPEGSQADMSSA